MSKCHVRELRNLYKHLFEDARTAFPTLETEFDSDITRLQNAVEQRGLQVYLVDLPAIGKHLDRCLADGQYKLSGLPLTKRYSGRVVIPKFLRGLYLLIFERHGCLKEDPSIEAIVFLRQILYAAKKTVLNCGKEKVDDEVKNFHLVDDLLPEPSSFWDRTVEDSDYYRIEEPGFAASPTIHQQFSEETAGCRLLRRFLVNTDRVSALMCAALGRYEPSEWSFRHGPGAISQVTGPTNKYSWTSWSEHLERVFPIADCGYHNHSSWASNCSDSISGSDPSSRLIAVPKTFSGPRLIAAEPSEHQWCQQNIWHYMDSRVKNSWIGSFISFRDQSRNQRLCLEGSLDGALCTVDLSAASDRVSCLVVENLFRSNPNLLFALRASRTRRITQTITRKCASERKLRKFSTMGSAVTFPVESLAFLVFALAAVSTVRGTRISRSSDLLALSEEVSVYGDDIVIPADCRELFVEALELLWFKVNEAKSYWTGQFRESCGVDSFRGCNITPVYWKRPYDGKPESLASVVETRNNFYKKWYMSTSSYLASTVQGNNVLPVPIDSGVFGLVSRVSPPPSVYKTRWNEELQRVEVSGAVLLARQRKTPTNDDSALFQYFTEAPSPHTKWVHGVSQRPSTKVRRGWVANLI